ncbi:lipoprotein ABC transporter ATP-binding protein [Candidatus Phytoplasma phoenicium]|uniref:Lipoprotein ABC transporter ATP-binding protein n=1 Tax=Candidatus Phytoplasma phoenicium TaxID=198422 RepID=A0A2S8NVJ2_9MOLU|nr:lipoprotein ABC transporter ATP-binding protein [Candidatus Phytoplasma phoenicium]
MIQVKNLSKFFFVKKSKIPLMGLNNINLKFPDKGLVFILGKSGSGKTTLVNLLGGIDTYDKGDILINSSSTRNFKQQDFDNYRNGSVGFVFQEFNLIEDMNVYDNIALALQLQGKKPEFKIILELLKKLDLSGFAKRAINELSGGQKQRVAIARAIVKNPSVVLADEPTGNLDSETSNKIFDVFKDLSKDRLVIIVTHDSENAYKYGDRVIEFKDGKIISDLSKNINQKVNNPRIEIKEGMIITDEILKEMQSLDNIKYKNLFAPTISTQILLKQKINSITQIKSHLPLKTALLLGASPLKKKKFSAFLISLIGIIILLFSIPINITQILATFKFYNKDVAIKLSKNFIKKLFFNQLSFFLIFLFLGFCTIGAFVKKSINLKKKDIGVLRALGARSKDVFKIFFTEGFIIVFLVNISFWLFIWLFYFISKLNFVRHLNRIVIYTIKIIYDLSFRFSVGNIGDLTSTESIKLIDGLMPFCVTIWYEILAGFVVAICIVIPSIYLPIHFIAKKKPIDVILNK